MCVAQVAPAVRVSMSEAFGLDPGAVSVKQTVTAMRLLGFDYVFGESNDMSFLTKDATLL